MAHEVSRSLRCAAFGEVARAPTTTKRNVPKGRALSWELPVSPLRMTASTPSAMTSINLSLKSKSSLMSGYRAVNSGRTGINIR